jgi:hypothetical protein
LPPRSTQEATQGLQMLFSSSQGFALTSDPKVYSSSPLRGLASCVPNSSTGSVVNAANNGTSARLLSSNPTRSFKTYRNKCHCLTHRHLPLLGEPTTRPINLISPIATRCLTRITLLS